MILSEEHLIIYEIIALLGFLNTEYRKEETKKISLLD